HLERGSLVDRLGLDQALLLQERYEWRHAVVAQPSSVNRLGDEVVAQGVHLDERRHLGRVAEVVAVDALRQGRRGLGLGRDDPGLWTATQATPEEREGEPGEVRAAAGAADDDVGLLAREGHLLDGLLADHRL